MRFSGFQSFFNWSFDMLRNHFSRKLLVAGLLAFASAPSFSATVFWADWTSEASTPAGYSAQATITTDTRSVGITYSNPNGIAFSQLNGGTDYYTSGGVRNAATSPFTSARIDNIPTGTDIIALRFAGTQTLTFSAPITNPTFAYISLNGNGYGFDQDFDILSFGDPSDGNTCGFWGCGTSFKDIVGAEFQLRGTGEPHGVIQFRGTFSNLSWRSLSNENWNGFTLGISSVVDPVIPPPSAVPVPASVSLIMLGLVGLGVSKRRGRFS
jgi:hypothetical protein